MSNTYVMMTHKRASEDAPWKRTAVIANEPFTEQDWQEKVMDARDFFIDLGGSETYPDKHTVDYINPSGLGRIIYQLQNTEKRRQNIDQALIHALSAFTSTRLLEIVKDDFAEERFDWQGDADFLNQTTRKELRLAIGRVLDNSIKIQEC